jgi:hypothetical protein
LANKEHKLAIEGIEICQHAQRRKHRAFWLNKKRGKNEREILFYFAKKEKIHNCFEFLVAIFRNLRCQQKSQFFGFLVSFFCKLFFVFENNYNIFFIAHALPKKLINVGHDFQKVPMI